MKLKNIICLEKDEVLCREGDTETDLFFIESGKLLVCLKQNKKVTPLAYLEKGDFVGEMSFFDRGPRSANVLAVEKSSLLKISSEDITHHFPGWLLDTTRFLVEKIRELDHIVGERGIKKKSSKSVPAALPVDEEVRLVKILENP